MSGSCGDNGIFGLAAARAGPGKDPNPGRDNPEDPLLPDPCMVGMTGRKITRLLSGKA